MQRIQFYMIVIQAVSLIIMLFAIHVAKLSLKGDNLKLRRSKCFEVISLEALALVCASIYKRRRERCHPLGWLMRAADYKCLAFLRKNN